MYPEKKREPYPKSIAKTEWDEPLQRQNAGKAKIGKTDVENVEACAKCLLNSLVEYFQSYFDKFGHYIRRNEIGGDWWHRTNFGTSYQPMVQMCFILKGQALGFDVREHHAQTNITDYAREVHNIEYNRETKCKSYKNIDICWAKDDTSYLQDNLILAFEYEDSGAIKDLIKELYTKLLLINSKCMALGGRINSEVGAKDIADKIGTKLIEKSIEKSLIFIFIYPDSLRNPTKIFFAQYIYSDSKIRRIDNNGCYVEVFVENTSGHVKIKKYMVKL